ncbi:MAG: hypothetical protein UX80_C0004G0010 [Candidatus Amesbacteria bacterium GW2011_GWA2_47_11b]|uniref:Uncharacterized protein n=3 Tax=Candidatus Amesiibacteriota TaxID=1752730 RepID=A0A0G1SHK1_9BACT|nr:MAG: hypothetical protein UX42_C0012G0018 [Microgenomates group bacterium GW2011_GWC1_46_20]KKU58259.1 MAG: hypothetical protein UX80_C0004G0010 [Candidatus Amesbacteria bacterium GW2011_GWA2_47_11b]KKU68896.1 MAG: hypothetical protein UX92_C0017G0003 [Candidatus Amesbacteria bacterium GW2011_GWA1_47_20]KKU84773.1 MAG: hypothetical protein UY11_C0004G0015 [Candidatus Amesbacteria bacterium GW2011_GWC2_47_8]
MKQLAADIYRHIKIFWLISANAVSSALYTRYGAVMFTTGKILRILTFSYFLYLLVSRTQTLSGYTVIQTIFFFLVFNVIDTAAQFLFRDVYRFRSKVVTGDLDWYFIKPLNPLLRSLFGGIDIMDFAVLVPLVGLTIWFIPQISAGPVQSLLFIFLLANSLLLSAAFHIFVLGLGITTIEVDHAVMIFRDLTSMGRIPIDVYKYPINVVLTTVVPIGVMMTIPAKALMGLASPGIVIFSFLISAFCFFLSLRYWRYAVTCYSSASS